MSQRPFPAKGSRICLVGQTVSPGTGGIIACSAEGWVRINLQGGGFMDIYADKGTSALPDALITGVASSSSFTPLATNVVVSIFDY